MPDSEAAGYIVGPAEVAAMLRDMQQENILLILPPLVVLSVILFLLGDPLSDPLRFYVPFVALSGLLLAFAALCGRHHLLATWLLVSGCLAVDLLVVAWSGITAALWLLALPVGIAALYVSVPAGALVAGVCSALLAWAPAEIIPPVPALRVTTVIGIWSAVGLVWLTLRPLLTTLQWSWSSWERSQRLLEQGRDQQVRLKQALADLVDANTQLTRLNLLAQRLRREADEARRAKEQFVANVSHELRTPLNMVIGFSETILQAPQAYGKLPPALLADLTIILRNSEHLSSLIDDVLDLSRIEAGQMVLTKERVALADIIEGAVIAVRPLFSSKGLYLETEVPADLTLFCDRTRIREVLLNLLSNAGRFTERGGVRVRAWREGSAVLVSVADTGPGIAAQDTDKLFRPFQQINGSLRRRYSGSGLGLSISKSFVELHGGTMTLESEVGRGTTISFRLPMEPPAPAGSDISRWFSPHWHYEERTRRPVAPPSEVRPRLIVLETGNSLQRLLARYLGNVELVAAATLEEALQEMARVPAQALLINQGPVGDELQRINAAALPNGTPAVILSVTGALEAANALGAADYLVKPVARGALLGALNRLQLRGNTVLIVDDEPDAVRLFRRMLNSAERSFQVLSATDGRQGLRTLRERRPDVVLLDLVMPHTDGFQFLAEKNADEALRDIPVVLVSATDPSGQPIVTKSLAITRDDGLSVPQILACTAAISGAAALAGRSLAPGSPGGASA